MKVTQTVELISDIVNLTLANQAFYSKFCIIVNLQRLLKLFQIIFSKIFNAYDIIIFRSELSYKLFRCSISDNRNKVHLEKKSQLIKPSISIIFIKIQKNIQHMADFPEDLNYGVTLADPEPKIGTGYNPPKVNSNSPNKTTDEEAASTGNNDKYDLKKAAHPTACIATFGFKALAFFFYLIIGSIIDSKIITFILVILLCSLDFWVVKNITGRLLVGLRWWSQIDTKGKQSWRFENPSKDRVVNKVDSAFFWTSQLAATAAWGVFLLINVLSLSIFWSLLLSICASLSGTNLYAYYLCRGDHKKKVSDLKKQGIQMFLSNAM